MKMPPLPKLVAYLTGVPLDKTFALGRICQFLQGNNIGLEAGNAKGNLLLHIIVAQIVEVLSASPARVADVCC
jgi:hypothetical protein